MTDTHVERPKEVPVPAPARRVGIARWVAFAALLGVLFVGWRWLGGSPAPQAAGGGQKAAEGAGGKAPSGIPVLTQRVRRKDMEELLEVTGNLRTDQDVHVGSRIAGRVLRVTVKEGDRVETGQLLVELDDSDLKAQVARAQSAKHAASAKLAQLQHARAYRFTQLRSDLENAQSALRAANARVDQMNTQAKITESETVSREQAAQAQLQGAREHLKMMQDGARKQEKQQAELAVQQAKAEMDDARAHYERRAKLFAHGNISREEVEEAATKVKVAASAYNTAVQKQSLVTEGNRTEEVRMAEQEMHAAEQALREATGNRSRTQVTEQDIKAAIADREKAQAALNAATAAKAQEETIDDEIRAAQAAEAQAQADISYYSAQLRDTKVYSPVRGAVISRTVNPGESVTASSVLLGVTALDAVYLEAQVPERDIASVRVAMPADVTIDSIPGHHYAGTVREMIPVANYADKAFRVRITAQQRPGDPQLSPNGFGRATIHLGKHAGATVVPKDALKSEVGQMYVYTIENGKAKRVAVQLSGTKDDNDAEVVKGVEPGQIIISLASPAVGDGTPVTPKEQ